ncbi:MAG TPA: hypothetical protein VKF81_17955, partial [Blastocatellia bacterium]|nr:hypothetical protein [Blastocatellia bacterium]
HCLRLTVFVMSFVNIAPVLPPVDVLLSPFLFVTRGRRAIALPKEMRQSQTGQVNEQKGFTLIKGVMTKPSAEELMPTFRREAEISAR